jgi:GNAT superfamily N-acetyltransferase
MLLFDNNNITIKGMYIDPEYRNKGIGKLLYKTLIERAYSKNGSLYSDPEQISDNAIRVWESLKK